MECQLSVKTVLLVSVSIIVLLAAGNPSRPTASGPSAPSQGSPADGRALFQKHCAPCHGELGYGNGEAAFLLSPRPRDLTEYHFRLVSTDNGVPTDEDLDRVIRNGILGSSMPPHAHLTDGDVRALVAEVRRIMTEGRMERLLKEASAAGESLDAEDARSLAFRTPGKVLVPPRKANPTREALSNGRHLFVLHCASCHDLDGAGILRKDLVDSAGYPLFARNFGAGVLKGGATHEDLWRRIRGGMPGTPMPAMDLPDEEILDLVDYVSSLLRPLATEELTQRKTRFVARRLDADLLSSANAWKSVPASWVPMTPLWWRDDRITGARVQFAHDGNRLVVRMVWEDASNDADLAEQSSFSDAAAVQWTLDPDPPFYGMGQRGGEVELWYWRAASQTLSNDVTDLTRHVINDVDLSLRRIPAGEHRERSTALLDAHQPLYITGWGAGNPVSDPDRPPLDILKARGQGTLTSLPRIEKGVGTSAKYERGIWEVTLWRPLSGRDGSIELKPGTTASVAFALWNGAAGDRNGQKNVTIWHEIVIE